MTCLSAPLRKERRSLTQVSWGACTCFVPRRGSSKVGVSVCVCLRKVDRERKKKAAEASEDDMYTRRKWDKRTQVDCIFTSETVKTINCRTEKHTFMSTVHKAVLVETNLEHKWEHAKRRTSRARDCVRNGKKKAKTRIQTCRRSQTQQEKTRTQHAHQ